MKPNGTYAYKVQACNSAGCSDYSAVKQVVVKYVNYLGGPGNAAPSIPIVNVPTSDSDGKYTISWKSEENLSTVPVTYQVLNERGRYVYSGKGASITIVESSGTYSYKVRGCNTSGCSAFSKLKRIVVNIPSKPKAPTINVPSHDSDGRYTVSWNRVIGATSYRMDGELSGKLYSGSGLSVARVKPNGTYAYKVQACNSAGCSDFSAVKQVVVNIPAKPKAPTINVPSHDSDGRYTVSWNRVIGATSYRMDNGMDPSTFNRPRNGPRCSCLNSSERGRVHYAHYYNWS